MEVLRLRHRLRRDIDVVHNTQYFLATVAADNCSRLHGKPSVVNAPVPLCMQQMNASLTQCTMSAGPSCLRRLRSCSNRRLPCMLPNSGDPTGTVSEAERRWGEAIGRDVAAFIFGVNVLLKVTASGPKGVVRRSLLDIFLSAVQRAYGYRFKHWPARVGPLPADPSPLHLRGTGSGYPLYARLGLSTGFGRPNMDPLQGKQCEMLYDYRGACAIQLRSHVRHDALQAEPPSTKVSK